MRAGGHGDFWGENVDSVILSEAKDLFSYQSTRGSRSVLNIALPGAPLLADVARSGF